MKRIILPCMLLLSLSIMAQETRKETTVQTSGDSIIIQKGDGNVKIKVYEECTNNERTKEELIYEGVYLTRENSDRNTILDALPFAPRRPGYRNRFDPHSGGLYIGFSRMSNDFFSFDSDNKVSLDASYSWEVGANLFTSYLTLSHDRHWGMTFGLGWGYRSFRLDGNQAFLNINGKTAIFDGDE